MLSSDITLAIFFAILEVLEVYCSSVCNLLYLYGTISPPYHVLFFSMSNIGAAMLLSCGTKLDIKASEKLFQASGPSFLTIELKALSNAEP